MVFSQHVAVFTGFYILKSHRKNLSHGNLPFLLLARHQSRMFTILINLWCIAVAAPTFRLLQDAIEEWQTRFMSPFLNDTVDGQNPAPPRKMIIPLFIGFWPSHVVPGFLPSTVAIVNLSLPPNISSQIPGLLKNIGFKKTTGFPFISTAINSLLLSCLRWISEVTLEREYGCKLSQSKPEFPHVAKYYRRQNYPPWKLTWLVGGWANPFEKYARQFGSFPQLSGWTWKIFETTRW